MTVAELRQRLERMIEDGVDENAEVRIAMQPNHPLQSHVRGIVSANQLFDEGLVDDISDTDGCVWIVESQQVYDQPPRGVFDASC